MVVIIILMVVIIILNTENLSLQSLRNKPKIIQIIGDRTEIQIQVHLVTKPMFLTLILCFPNC